MNESDKDKVAQGVARRGEERANGPRGSTRATESTRKAASTEQKKGVARGSKSSRGKGPGLQTWDSGGGDISGGG